MIHLQCGSHALVLYDGHVAMTVSPVAFVAPLSVTLEGQPVGLPVGVHEVSHRIQCK